MVWPEIVDPSGDPVIVGSVQDLLEAVADVYDLQKPAKDLDEVAEWVFNFTEPYEVDIYENSPAGIVMTVRYWGLDFQYPFDLAALPANAEEVEGNCRAIEKNWNYLQQIEEVEGFSLDWDAAWETCFYDLWHWRDHGFASHDPTYQYARKAPDSWTVREWFDRRVRGDGTRAFTDFAVPVDDWSTTTLKEVRELSRAAQEAEPEGHQ